jgi:hypothetical protein
MAMFTHFVRIRASLHPLSDHWGNCFRARRQVTFLKRLAWTQSEVSWKLALEKNLRFQAERLLGETAGIKSTQIE